MEKTSICQQRQFKIHDLAAEIFFFGKFSVDIHTAHPLIAAAPGVEMGLSAGAFAGGIRRAGKHLVGLQITKQSLRQPRQRFFAFRRKFRVTAAAGQIIGAVLQIQLRRRTDLFEIGNAACPFGGGAGAAQRGHQHSGKD